MPRGTAALALDVRPDRPPGDVDPNAYTGSEQALVLDPLQLRFPGFMLPVAKTAVGSPSPRKRSTA
jgi:hypothetical protein